MTTETTAIPVNTANDVLKSWQGHRRLTRRTIEAFPEDKLFQFSVGGMRPFAEMAFEFIRMAVPIVDGVASGKWEEYKGTKPATKADLLVLWDGQTAELD
ncbi:MAG: damage-inducible protein DinB, partial [Terracidiphilus sp.]